MHFDALLSALDMKHRAMSLMWLYENYCKLNKTKNTARDSKCNFLLNFNHFETKPLILSSNKTVVLCFSFIHTEAVQLLYSYPLHS